MTYATSTMVKQRLGIEDSDTTYDTVIQAKLMEADAWVDAYTDTTHGTSPAQIIKEAAADRAAGTFSQDKFGERGNGPALLQRAEGLLDAWKREQEQTAMKTTPTEELL